MKNVWESFLFIFENSIKIVIGVFLIVLGIIGLFIPFLQGIVLIFLGLIVLGGKACVLKLERFYNWVIKKLT